MTEFPPQQPVDFQEALRPQEPVQVNYAALRDTYRALQNGTADREALLSLGAELEANAIYEPGEDGKIVGFRGSILHDGEGKTIPGEDGEPKRANIPKLITNVVYEAAKAARESESESAWAAAGKIDEIHNLSFSQAKDFARALNKGESFTSALTTAEEAPKTEEPVQETTKSDNKNDTDGDAKAAEETPTPATDPVSTALKQLKEHGGTAKLTETLSTLDDKQLEAVVMRMTEDLVELLGVGDFEHASQMDPTITARGLDEYLANNLLAGTPENVREIHRAAVRSFLDNVAHNDFETLIAIVDASENSYIHQNYHFSSETRATIETRREGVTPQAGDIAVRSQLPTERRDRYDLAA